MRGFTCFILLLMLASCGGGLSEDQRTALKEEMEDREIKKITEQQIFERSLALGRELVIILDGQVDIDSLAKAHNSEIIYAQDTTNLSKMQQMLFEAYSYSEGDVISFNDNVQKEDDEYIIFSSPKVIEDSLAGVWFIRLSKKEVILSL